MAKYTQGEKECINHQFMIWLLEESNLIDVNEKVKNWIKEIAEYHRQYPYLKHIRSSAKAQARKETYHWGFVLDSKRGSLEDDITYIIEFSTNKALADFICIKCAAIIFHRLYAIEAKQAISNKIRSTYNDPDSHQTFLDQIARLDETSKESKKTLPISSYTKPPSFSYVKSEFTIRKDLTTAIICYPDNLTEEEAEKLANIVRNLWFEES